MTYIKGVQARIQVLAEGGRQTPLFSGYRAGVHLGPDPKAGNDGFLEIEGRDTCAPGEVCVVRIEFVRPDLVQTRLAPNREFEIKEGGRLVARGTILKLVTQDG